MAKRKYYVVWKGHRTGIFEHWKDCESSIRGMRDARFKSFNNLALAEYAYQAGPVKNIWESMPDSVFKSLGQITPLPILNSYSVDAACSGNPGIMEYRGVDTKTGIVLFAQGPFHDATVNIGEFLAIVHALAQLRKEGKATPIYSDSQTAIKWVRDKRANTKLLKNSANQKVFGYLNRAVTWLKSHDYANEILKWDTENWGEIPADYGRK